LSLPYHLRKWSICAYWTYASRVSKVRLPRNNSAWSIRSLRCPLD